MSTKEDKVLCDYCGKSSEEVYKMAARGNVHICDECVRLCVIVVCDSESSGDNLDPVTCNGCGEERNADDFLAITEPNIESPAMQRCLTCLSRMLDAHIEKLVVARRLRKENEELSPTLHKLAEIARSGQKPTAFTLAVLCHTESYPQALIDDSHRADLTSIGLLENNPDLPEYWRVVPDVRLEIAARTVVTTSSLTILRADGEEIVTFNLS